MADPTQHLVPCASGDVFVRTWAPPEPTWLALVVHGYGEHAGRYQHVADQLTAEGALVCAPDHRGHGRSPGERVLIDDAERIVDDLDRLRVQLADEHPELPVVLIGHSLGGMFATRLAQRDQEQFRAIVLSAPVLGTWHVLDLLENTLLPDTPIDPESLSRDVEVGRDYLADPLVWHGAFKRSTLMAIDRCLLAINEGPQLDIPTLWLHGEEDEVVPAEDTRTGIDRIRGQNFYEHHYAGARHEVFNETNGADVIRDVVTFVQREISR